MSTYLDGIKDVFNIMKRHCKHHHQVQDMINKKKWGTCCFLLEEGEFNLENWTCCYEKCPLFKGEKE